MWAWTSDLSLQLPTVGGRVPVRLSLLPLCTVSHPGPKPHLHSISAAADAAAVRAERGHMSGRVASLALLRPTACERAHHTSGEPWKYAGVYCTLPAAAEAVAQMNAGRRAFAPFVFNEPIDAVTT